MIILFSFLVTIGVFVVASGLVALLAAMVAVDIAVFIAIVRRIFFRKKD